MPAGWPVAELLNPILHWGPGSVASLPSALEGQRPGWLEIHPVGDGSSPSAGAWPGVMGHRCGHVGRTGRLGHPHWCWAPGPGLS